MFDGVTSAAIHRTIRSRSALMIGGSVNRPGATFHFREYSVGIVTVEFVISGVAKVQGSALSDSITTLSVADSAKPIFRANSKQDIHESLSDAIRQCGVEIERRIRSSINEMDDLLKVSA